MTLPPLPLLRRVSRDLQDLYAVSIAASDSRGQGWSADEPKSRSLTHASARRGTGSTQRKMPLPPKWPNVRSEFPGPGP